jgi:GWxTD domain-containing protein
MKTLMEFSQHPAIHALGWTLLHFLWQGTAVAILLAGVLWLLSSRRPQWRYVAACGALVLMLVLPLATWWHLAGSPQSVVSAIPFESHAGRAFQGSWSGTPEPWRDQVARELDQAVPWVISIWFAGVMLLWSRLNIGLIAAWRMKSLATEPATGELRLRLQKVSRRLGVARAIKLVNSTAVEVPMVIGWLRPAILIPVGCLAGLSASQVEALLAHELAHIRRHDYLVNIFQSVVETLLFYHPAVWWISKQIRREREHCCDDWAISMSGDPLSYAKALSFLAEHQASVPVVALGASGGSLATRIRRLLGGKEPPAISRLAATTLLTAAFAAMGLCLGAMAHAQAKTSEPPATESSKSPPEELQAAEKNVSIHADSQQKDKDTLHLRGNVDIAFEGMQVKADEATFDEATGDVTARGHVVFTDRQSHLVAEEVHYNVRTHKGWFNNGKGSVHGAIAYAQTTASEHPAAESSERAPNLPGWYEQWPSEEVPYLITNEERAAFEKLPTDDERQLFIQQFWDRRNPKPGSAENEFKEEYYRRIAYANEHFAANVPGWKTDRGRIYIMYGPPDEIDSHPVASANFAKPTDIWRYRYIDEYAPPKPVIVQGKTELKGQTIRRLNVEMKFVDACSCGDYRLESPPKN